MPVTVDWSDWSDQQLDQELTRTLRALELEQFEAAAAEADRRREQAQQRLGRTRALAATAAWYAARGVKVFPCAPRGKRPATEHGFHDASCDPDQVRRWWQATPDANIGAPTGHWWDVVDIDGHDGHISVAGLRARGLLPEPLALARTPGSSTRPPGMHYFIPPTGDGNGTRIAPGVDYRGRGGYVILPPSHAPGGRQYAWLTPPPPPMVGDR